MPLLNAREFSYFPEKFQKLPLCLSIFPIILHSKAFQDRLSEKQEESSKEGTRLGAVTDGVIRLQCISTMSACHLTLWSDNWKSCVFVRDMSRSGLFVSLGQASGPFDPRSPPSEACKPDVSIALSSDRTLSRSSRSTFEIQKRMPDSF